MNKILLLFLVLLFHSAGAQWITRNNMTEARQEGPSVVVDGKIYTMGGISDVFTVRRTTEVYDPSTDSWSFADSLPVPRHHHAMCALNGKIYVMGGYADLNFIATDDVFMYDPVLSAWTTKMHLPVAIGAGDATAFNGKIYFIGGANAGVALNICLEYDPLTDTWTQKSDMPTPREHLCVVTADTLIYAIAGRGSFGAQTAVQAYNPVTDSWTTAPQLPTARSGCDAAVVNGKIFVLGGEGSGVFDENEMFDPVNQLWYQLDSMPHARHGIGAVSIGDTIYATGGATVAGYAACTYNEAFLAGNVTSITGPEFAENNFSVFPNPVLLNVTIQAKAETDLRSDLIIRDELGRTVINRQWNLQQGVNSMNINMDQLSQGSYILFISDKKQIHIKKLVVIK